MRNIFVQLLSALLSFTMISAFNVPSWAVNNENLDQQFVELSGDSIITDSDCATVDGSILTIHSGGYYLLSGVLNNGQIIINTGNEEEKVTLELNGVMLSNSSDAVIVVEKADKVKLILSEGTDSVLTSGNPVAVDSFREDASGAVIFSQCDLDIKGSGTLQINGRINNGITCKKDIDIEEVSLVIHAANNGIKGTRSVHIKSGSITIDSGNDGLKSTCTTREGKGWIKIEDGNLSITSSGDGISAATDLVITGGGVSIHAGKDIYNYGASCSIAPNVFVNEIE